MKWQHLRHTVMVPSEMQVVLGKKCVPHAFRLKRRPQAGTLTLAAALSHWEPGLHLHPRPSPVTHTLSNDALIKVVLAALWIIICVKICGLKAFAHSLSI